jgi:hypothetical protein
MIATNKLIVLEFSFIYSAMILDIREVKAGLMNFRNDKLKIVIHSHSSLAFQKLEDFESSLEYT